MFRYLIARALTVISFLCTAALGQTPVGRTIPGRFIVTYRNGAVPAAARSNAEALGAVLVQRQLSLGIAIVQATPQTAASVKAQLAADPAVASVVEDRVVAAHTLQTRAANTAAATADALYNSPQGWAIQQVGGYGSASSPGPWSVTTGSGVRIAILDSGVDATHPDIGPQPGPQPLRDRPKRNHRSSFPLR
jgi:hypothetical protein